MEVEFSQKYCPRLLKLSYHLGIYQRHPVSEQIAGRGCTDTRGIHHIFERDGNTVQGTQPQPLLDVRLCSSRFVQSRVRGHGNEGVQLGIALLDSKQARFCQFDRRHLLTANELGRLGERERRQIRTAATLGMLHGGIMTWPADDQETRIRLRAFAGPRIIFLAPKCSLRNL